MADWGNIIAGFVKGSTGYAVDRIAKREDAEAELRKQQMLEQLRKETAKELALFEEDLPSNKLRREKEQRQMEYDAEEQDYKRQVRPLELSAKEKELSYMDENQQFKREDQAMQRERLSLERASTAESIRASRASRSGRTSMDRNRNNDQILFAEYNNAIKELKDAGANPSVLANFQTAWYDGINKKKWTPTQQEAFISTMRHTFTGEWKGYKGKKQRPLLESFGSANSLLDSKLKD